MFEHLEDVRLRYEEVLAELSAPEIMNDATAYRKRMQEQAELEPVVEKYLEKRRVTRRSARWRKRN